MRRKLLAANIIGISLLLFPFLFGGCSSPYVKKPVPKHMVGDFLVDKIEVDKLVSVHSSAATEKIKDAIRAKLNKRPGGSQVVNMKVTIEKWQTPDNQIGGTTFSKLIGTVSEVRGLVKIIAPQDDSVIAEYRAVATFKEGGVLSGTFSIVNVEGKLLSDFAYFVLDQIY